jgi:hypothetical protein
MKIVCSWCRREGIAEIVGEKAPLDDARETHGICVNHRREVQIHWQESGGVIPGSGVTHGPVMSSVLFRWSGLLKVTRKIDP